MAGRMATKCSTHAAAVHEAALRFSRYMPCHTVYFNNTVSDTPTSPAVTSIASARYHVMWQCKTAVLPANPRKKHT